MLYLILSLNHFKSNAIEMARKPSSIGRLYIRENILKPNVVMEVIPFGGCV
jgi:hypothetical protein